MLGAGEVFVLFFKPTLPLECSTCVPGWEDGEKGGGREREVPTQHSLAVIYRLGQTQIDSYARNVNGIETFDGEAHFQT